MGRYDLHGVGVARQREQLDTWISNEAGRDRAVRALVAEHGQAREGVAVAMRRLTLWRCMAATMSRVPSAMGVPIVLPSGPSKLMTASFPAMARAMASASVSAPSMTLNPALARSSLAGLRT